MNEVSYEQKMHHDMGIEMNIQTWNLLEKEGRNERDDARMISFAHASLYHWRKSHKYKPINEQRGQWLLSHVYAVSGKSKEALFHAKKTQKLTIEQNLKDSDRAYAYEALARANAAIGSKYESLKNLWNAQMVVNDITNEDDKNNFISVLESSPWFGVKYIP
ncbi:MAG: hypothetical protein QF380_02225 [Candidatus Marinimicrobia bacterium]|jgi:hypothetical protein|nr:hypothetical protein [Candidatus Neomarinimicrobiota bacterium]